MKNINVYIGTIRKCLNVKNFKEDGNYTFISDCEFGSFTTKIQIGYNKPNVETINEQAILIENQYGHFYNYKINNSFIDNLKIILDDSRNIIKNNPSNNDEIFYDEDSLIPYYEEQPKKLSFKKLKNDILLDPRIKTGIEH